ncbi:ATP synthase F1 subunit delta [Ilyobacter polytropus]|uniref:ATP synthase subunit delta n=1 Tax=Ilyobacter polytropus (strain ATCC 51220 / DSM 2926 / LMG 16218 / CuHBu1) TaxID=572544 RepID=E3H897_ILYPC|nr:ATP synthase F1 subunit delta [Ilyobacter polytropus]ADO81993.1 ATP synthase F1 subcomplex delta subunit [Ilyobacter polytropus DSM 2926]
MIEAQVGKRYAEAIYEMSESNKKVKELYEELNLVMELYKGDKEFKNLVDHPLIKVEEKKEFIGKIFSKFEDFSLNVLFYLVEKKRLSYIKSIVAEYLKIYYTKNQIVDVEAIFAIEPSEEQKTKLIKKLEKKTEKKVNLVVSIDKSIIAGGIIKIGDEIIDGSVRRQLDTVANN